MRAKEARKECGFFTRAGGGEQSLCAGLKGSHQALGLPRPEEAQPFTSSPHWTISFIQFLLLGE